MTANVVGESETQLHANLRVAFASPTRLTSPEQSLSRITCARLP